MTDRVTTGQPGASRYRQADEEKQGAAPEPTRNTLPTASAGPSSQRAASHSVTQPELHTPGSTALVEKMSRKPAAVAAARIATRAREAKADTDVRTSLGASPTGYGKDGWRGDARDFVVRGDERYTVTKDERPRLLKGERHVTTAGSPGSRQLERLPRGEVSPGTHKIPGTDPARDAIDRDYGPVFREFKESETPFKAPDRESPPEMWGS